ncbi:MAG TPA: RnfABCDGE type electron transport complex subunit G [Bacteroidales bacterium]|nr:RnfABCDGE type electron transport complex subunit G [Bacteroidales bacterium]HRZ48973.1 RnfABCDGE type electron transport complex subunit G [Bacteroidales bacterium]
MAKTESTFTNMVATMVIIMVLAGLSLAGVVNLTADAIAKSEKEKMESALKEVLPPFDNDIAATRKEVKVNEKDKLVLYFAKKGGEDVGVAIETFTNKGFSGNFRIMVGFRPDGTIINTSVLEHHETPGLGDKMDVKKSKFPNQFKDKSPADFKLQVKKDGGSVDAITAATISSRAFCDAVQRAYDEFVKQGGKQQ